MAAKDLYEKDLYSILGVKKSDDAAAVKKQYRKLARELHPDKTKGDKKLEEKFKSVSEAYEVLSDDKKRAEYDEMREAFKGGRIRKAVEILAAADSKVQTFLIYSVADHKIFSGQYSVLATDHAADKI